MAHLPNSKIATATDADLQREVQRQRVLQDAAGSRAVRAGASRRDFVRMGACAALGATGVLNQIWDMRKVAAATTAAPGDEYKALVCIFLYGGNDANNTVVPRGGGDYNAYAAARQGLALPQGQLHAINPSNNYQGPALGLHPAMGDMADLFNSGKVALLANVGTLVEPMTLAEYQGGFKTKPLQLFSHSDQQFQWQTSISTGGAATGWGGRAAEILDALNNNPDVSMSISLNGTNTFQVAEDVSIFQVGTGGPTDMWGYGWGHPRDAARDALLSNPYDNLFQGEHARIFERGLANNELVDSALDTVNANTSAFNAFPDSYLAKQLKMIAQLIAARNYPGMPDRRQVFFAGVGGYDTHGSQLNAHNDLLTELNGAMKAFYDVLGELGVGSNVTTFTASDFGRNYVMNGDNGSDHGWGCHTFVMGDDVDGGKLYGQMPTLAVNGPDDVGIGRWLPTTSVDEYGATLARWIGVGTNDMEQVFPNLYRFANGYDTDLGFMK